MWMFDDASVAFPDTTILHLGDAVVIRLLICFILSIPNISLYRVMALGNLHHLKTLKYLAWFALNEAAWWLLEIVGTQARTQDFRKGGPTPKRAPAPLKGHCRHVQDFPQGGTCVVSNHRGGGCGRKTFKLCSFHATRNVKIPFKRDSFHATP